MSVKKVISTILSTLWIIYFIIGIVKNMSHYRFADWVVLLALFMMPYIIYFIIKLRKKKSTPLTQKTDEPTENTAKVEKAEKVENYPVATPPETLNAMRKVITNNSANEIIHIIQDSYSLCQSTNSLETFESRLDVATRNAYTLKQMEQANLYGGSPSSEYFLNILIGNRSDLTSSFLKRAFHAALSKAKNELKTQNGISKRMSKFFSEIENSALDFDEELISTLKKEI